MNEQNNQSTKSSLALHGRDKLLNQLEDFLKGAPGDQVELVLEAEQIGVTRYAHSRIHQNVSHQDSRLWVRVLVNGAVASMACNSLDPATVRETIQRAAKTARMLPDRTHQGFAARNDESQGERNEDGGTRNEENTLNSSPSFFESTAGQTAVERADAIGRIVELIGAAGFEGYGTYTNTVTELAVANSRGLRAYAPATSGYIKALVETAAGDSAGYADQLERDVTRLDPEKAAAIAIQKCRLNVNQRELAPGDYAAVLEPNAVADMVRFMVYHGCGAQQLQDGRSFMTGRMGEQVTGANINFWEDPGHPHAIPFPLDYEGLQARRVPLVIAGQATGVVYDRTTAAKEPGRVSTGHAGSPWNSLEQGPTPSHIVMEAGTRSIEELVSGLKRGLIVTRLHYTHCPDPRRVVATGTTRDGTFLVENGEIVAAVKNLRFTQSVLELLAGVEELGQPKTCQDWWSANGMSSFNYYLPALRVARCTFTGATTF